MEENIKNTIDKLVDRNIPEKWKVFLNFVGKSRDSIIDPIITYNYKHAENLNYLFRNRI